MVSAMISKEIIKPSSPTPPHLNKLQLSFLDQLSPPIYVHIILYFESSHDSAETTSRNLKRSLSDALALYYPLAGRLRENSWIDCTDAGAEYVEAKFNDDRILDVVENPKIEELKKYVPSAPASGDDIPLAVQVNFFGCGGIAIGVCMSHKAADAMSMVMFINTWAAACRRDVKAIAVAQPSFDLSSRFPPAEFSSFLALPPAPLWPSPEKIVTKRFVFYKEKLNALKKVASGPVVVDPTRVEAVSAFIMKYFIKTYIFKNKMNIVRRTFAATHAVDIRQRAAPPLPHQFFGNACARAMAMAPENQSEPNYHDLVVSLRNAIRKADREYVRRLENGENFLKYYSVNEENDPAFKDGRKVLEICSFTSWARLPAYEANYGWGRPVWVSTIDVPQKNLVVFLGNKSGDGIEAWVNMVEEDMALIESNYNVLGQMENVTKLL